MSRLIVAICLLVFGSIVVSAKKVQVNRKSEFVQLFSRCPKKSPTFDECIKKGLNDARAYFKYGVPEFNLPPFDPFFAEEVIQMKGGSSFNYKLTLRNVYESGWTDSHVYKFKSDLKSGLIQYHQFFPAKFLDGEWEIESSFLGPYSNSGRFELSLYNYTQVTTVSTKKGRFSDPNTPYNVWIQAIDLGNMEIHVKNLIDGAPSSLDSLLDKMLNISWRPGFMILKPLIDDLVSRAFTKIFNDAFKNFPFDKVFYK